MNFKNLGILAFCALVCGSFYFAWQQQIIMFMWPYAQNTIRSRSKGAHKQIQLLVNDISGQWRSEVADIVWSSDQAENIKHALQALANTLHDQGFTETKISITSVLVDYANLQAFVSFDHTPLRAQASTREKYMVIESMLKTLSFNQITQVQSVRFLCNHQVLNDEHIDFSIDWPIHGFTSTR